MSKEQKEFTNLLSAINKWHKVNKGEVCFIGSFVSFEPKSRDVKDDRLVAFGCKENIKLSMKVLAEHLKKDKEHFINW